MKNTVTPVGGVLAAVLASLCCISPVALPLVGVGGAAPFSIFEEYRPHLVGLTIVLLGAAFFLTYRRREVKCEDGTLKVESAGTWNKIGVWGATVVAASAMTFPYFGFSANSPVSGPLDRDKIDFGHGVGFFNVPLICNAAPDIGCGSRAKFIMLDLMKESEVKEAWLNRNGTILAVVWNESTHTISRQAAAIAVFSRHDLPLEQIREENRNAILENFEGREKWYQGPDVDALSIEEAGIIADRIVSRISPNVAFTRDDDKQDFREDVNAILKHCFLSLRSFGELNDSTYHRVEKEVIAAGEKYLGKGNMPALQLTGKECILNGQGSACCSDEWKTN